MAENADFQKMSHNFPQNRRTENFLCSTETRGVGASIGVLTGALACLQAEQQVAKSVYFLGEHPVARFARKKSNLCRF